jgi:hypothetical protein
LSGLGRFMDSLPDDFRRAAKSAKKPGNTRACLSGLEWRRLHGGGCGCVEAGDRQAARGWRGLNGGGCTAGGGAAAWRRGTGKRAPLAGPRARASGPPPRSPSQPCHWWARSAVARSQAVAPHPRSSCVQTPSGARALAGSSAVCALAQMGTWVKGWAGTEVLRRGHALSERGGSGSGQGVELLLTGSGDFRAAPGKRACGTGLHDEGDAVP